MRRGIPARGAEVLEWVLVRLFLLVVGDLLKTSFISVTRDDTI